MADLQRLVNTQGPPFLRASEPDSRRFELKVGRAEIGTISTGGDVLVKEIVASAFDVIVLRYPAQETGLFAQLMGPAFHVIHADSLMYSEKPLADAGPEELEQFACRTASKDDAAVISDLVDAAFDDYPSHYSANPLLSPRRIRAGYVEWALTFVADENRELLLLSSVGDDEVKAFSAVEIATVGEIVLAGVHPAWRMQGWYNRAFAAAEDSLRRRGCSSAWTSTQISNVASQRNWRTRGYIPRLSFQTVHLVRRDLWEPTTGPAPVRA